MKKTSILLGLLFATAIVVSAQHDDGSPVPSRSSQTQVAVSDSENKAAKESDSSCCHLAKTSCHTGSVASRKTITTPEKGAEALLHASGHGCH